MSLSNFINRVKSEVDRFKLSGVTVTRLIVSLEGEKHLIRTMLSHPDSKLFSTVPLEILSIPLGSHRGMPRGGLWYVLDCRRTAGASFGVP